MIFDSGYHIEVLEGFDRGKRFPLLGKELTLGRKLIPNERISNWILFNEPTVSRIHALLIWEEKSRTYELHHKSRTNPTLINAITVEKKKLEAGDRIQMGLLVFHVLAGSSEAGVSAQHPDSLLFKDIPAGTHDRRDAFLLTDHKGTCYPLTADLIMIGWRENPAASMGPNEILLDDSSIPREHLLLVWNVKEHRYGIIKVESSRLISCLHRKKEGLETVTDITSEKHVPLEEGDLLFIGNSVLRFEGPEKAPVKASRSSPPEVKAKSLPLVPVAKDAKSPQALSGDGKHSRQRRGDTLSISPAARGKAQRVTGEASESDTVRWNVHADYTLSVAAGPDKGAAYSFVSSDLREGRSITLGSRGVRVNDICFSDSQIHNRQAVIVFKKGKFYIKNEYPQVQLKVNRTPVQLNQSIELQSGDHIKAGRTRLLFLDHNVENPLCFYKLEVLEGAAGDRGKAFDISGETVRIGRAVDCEVLLSDREVSPLHSLIKFRENNFYLEHVSGVNPTLLNGISMLPGAVRQLHQGDRIRLSSKTLLAFDRK